MLRYQPDSGDPELWRMDLWSYGAMEPRNYGAMEQLWSYGAMDQWANGPMSPWIHETMTHGPMDPWTRGSKGSRSPQNHKNLLRKLNAKNVAGLVRKAIEFGLINEE